MSKFCPSCGEELVDSAKFCKNCGKNLETLEDNPHVKKEEFTVQSVEKDYTILIVIGYVCAVIFQLASLIISIYLLTRKNSKNASKHGKYILILTVLIWVLSILMFH